MACPPHPAKKATSRGPKSRAGLKPPCVSGASRLIKTATVNPTKNGHMPPRAIRPFRLSVSAKIMKTRMAVPNASTAAAPAGEIERPGGLVHAYAGRVGEVLAEHHRGALAAFRAAGYAPFRLEAVQKRAEHRQHHQPGDHRAGKLRGPIRGNPPRRVVAPPE